MIQWSFLTCRKTVANFHTKRNKLLYFFKSLLLKSVIKTTSVYWIFPWILGVPQQKKTSLCLSFVRCLKNCRHGGMISLALQEHLWKISGSHSSFLGVVESLPGKLQTQIWKAGSNDKASSLQPQPANHYFWKAELESAKSVTVRSITQLILIPSKSRQLGSSAVYCFGAVIARFWGRFAWYQIELPSSPLFPAAKRLGNARSSVGLRLGDQNHRTKSIPFSVVGLPTLCANWLGSMSDAMENRLRWERIALPNQNYTDQVQWRTHFFFSWLDRSSWKQLPQTAK